MSQKIFVPVTDELLYDRPELITSQLRPFQIGRPCFHWLSVEVEAVDPATVDMVVESAAADRLDGFLGNAPGNVAANATATTDCSIHSTVSVAETDEQLPAAYRLPVRYRQPSSYLDVLKQAFDLPCKTAA